MDILILNLIIWIWNLKFQLNFLKFKFKKLIWFKNCILILKYYFRI
jgi:hypothetical protein